MLRQLQLVVCILCGLLALLVLFITLRISREDDDEYSHGLASAVEAAQNSEEQVEQLTMPADT